MKTIHILKTILIKTMIEKFGHASVVLKDVAINKDQSANLTAETTIKTIAVAIAV